MVDTLVDGEEITVSVPWDTTGYTGTQMLTVIADPHDRLVEIDENNNQASITCTILTRPDLRIPALAVSPEVVQGQLLTLTATVSNAGQTDAPTFTLALYEGAVSTATLLYTTTLALPAGSATDVSLPWTAAELGPQTLIARADDGEVVDEFRETNNQRAADLYVGWAEPVYVDAGGDPDPIYDPEWGYGLISTDTTVITGCGQLPYQTYRRGVYGKPLEYRFDHLLASHYYHLDAVMSLCSGSRSQFLWIDGSQEAGPLNVVAGSPLRHSLLIDSQYYTDHVITAGVTAAGLGAPVIAELTLTEIDYCYRDSGHPTTDPAWTPGYRCGYNDPTSQGSNIWGNLPTQTIRFDDTDQDVVYRFSDLFADRMYAVNLTLYEGDGAGRVQTVQVDGVTVGPTVTLSGTPQYVKIYLPPSSYQGDAVVDLAVVETTGNIPVVSEIALEEVTLSEPPVPAFSAAPLSGTAPLSVTFSDQSTGGLVLNRWWRFGDGLTSTLANPMHVYSEVGSYTVSLALEGPGGVATETKPAYINVYQAVTADFTAAPTAGVVPLTVAFTNTSSGDYDQSLWSFGDGYTSTLQHPSHVYTSVGVYTVDLTVSGPGGVDTATQEDLIQVYEPVQAAFSAEPTAGCLSLTVQFSDESSGELPIEAWRWDLGDGASSDQPDPQHTYELAGTFTVTLAVSDAFSSDVASGTITVYPLPQAAFDYSPHSGAVSLTVVFTDTSPEGQDPEWAFGDGSYGSGAVVSHTYVSTGSFTVLLTVTSPYDCGQDTAAATVLVVGGGPPVAAFSAEPLEGCAPLQVQFSDESAGDPPIFSWDWDFGDGYTSTLQHPLHTYDAAGAYTVVLSVESPSGTAAVSDTITVYPPPEASFDYAPNNGLAPLTVWFTNTSSAAVNPVWTFGDGGFDTGDVVSHTYESSGTYQAMLVVGSPYGCGDDSASAPVLVGALCEPVQILAVLTDVTGCAVDFSATVSGTEPYSWLWSFGDGVTSTLAAPSYEYASSGVYLVTVEVENCAGLGYDEHSFSVTVECATIFDTYLPLVLKGEGS